MTLKPKLMTFFKVTAYSVFIRDNVAGWYRMMWVLYVGVHSASEVVLSALHTSLWSVTELIVVVVLPFLSGVCLHLLLYIGRPASNKLDWLIDWLSYLYITVRAVATDCSVFVWVFFSISKITREPQTQLDEILYEHVPWQPHEPCCISRS